MNAVKCKINELPPSTCSPAELETLQKALVLRKFLSLPYYLYASLKKFTAELRISLILQFTVQNAKGKKAFTLIEMVVAVAIFTIFISMIAGTYLYIARAQRDTGEVRKVYSSVRDVVEEMSKDIKLMNVYYDCYEEVVSGIDGCDGTFDLSHGLPSEELFLIDGDEAKVFTSDDEGFVTVMGYEMGEGSWMPTSGYEEGAIAFSDLEILGVYFEIYPYSDPAENYEDIDMQFQPYVTIYLDTEDFDLQTSISTRSYGEIN